MRITKHRVKRCVHCKQFKRLNAFNKQHNTKDGYRSWCLQCSNRESRDWYRRHKEKSRKDKLRAYGLTLESFAALDAAQNHQCAICKASPVGNLQVDHCHTTNVVRGLLCGNCNRALGLFRDSVTSLAMAITYLQRFKKLL